MRIRRTLLASALAVAAAGTVLTGGSASASISPPSGGYDHAWTVDGMTVYIEEHGDIVKLCDSKADGKVAQVYVGPLADLYRYSMTIGGLGSCITHKASEGGKYNLPERQIRVRFFNRKTSRWVGERDFYNDH